ncbi:methyl-accepting chemotaxis protein [Anaerotignum propionicum]|jgi:methyl-accepting chemotaxis protein|uniref:Methyl-accepting chemotaxis protein n=1 Tax=Anaerotignum propionicum DSM 1682 TaxID=991789 RepID=A0A0X8VA24_ANAPI|nr:methyl-accepting chemotaxis protein [Anaerotignum propionicum]AMJ40190.1 methyl-accepting chemotaxis protein 4 [Anaerotignum propionicum DSM 1682]SHF10128.1 methyl-accepting chemotaxis protein [[Clostridium] propionicum DSM 1682] [Anaerotignum propionicum DSM 1682]
MLKTAKLKTKIVLLFGAIILTTIFIQGMVSFIQLTKSHNATINAYKENFDTLIEVSVDNLISVLDVNHQRYLDGEITHEEEMKAAEKIVRDTRYNDGEGYFWADLESGVCAVHMNPEFEGAQRLQAQDKAGNLYIQNLIAAGKQPNGGFTEYYFTKPNEEGVFKKRGYTKKYEPYGWYISTGNYYDDIDKIIEQYQKDKYLSLLGIAACGAAVGAFGIFWMFVIAGRITGHLKRVTDRLTLLSQGDLHSPVIEVHTGDEFETLSLATKQTVDNLSGIMYDIHEVMKRFSAGNFVINSTLEYSGDLSGINDSIQSFSANISKTLSQINATSTEVARGSSQVSEGAQVLAQGATEQAASIQELAELANEMTETIHRTANDAAQAKQIAIDSSHSSVQGQQQMQEMIAAMEKISDASNEIGKIIKNIDDIAFQTNILALNAAVEAARAGEAGKGFAVVADEVRNLAGKSAESAKLTSQLIENSITAIANGSKIVSETAESLNHIILSSEKTADVIQSIADAAIQQKHSMDEVSNSLVQVSSVIQINSATSEESAAASEEISGQAEILKDLINHFQFQNQDSSFTE